MPSSELSHKDAIMNNSNIFPVSQNLYSSMTDKSRRIEKQMTNKY